MQNVYIIGTGTTPVAEHFDKGMAELAQQAMHSALGAVDPAQVGALYVGNALGGELAGQAHLGAALAAAVGLPGSEALRVEAAGASGGAALRQAYLAIASGAYDLVAVLGVEKVTDKLEGVLESGLALATDGDFEAAHGVTLTSQWAMLMRRYLYQYGYEADAFAPFPVNAHANGTANKGALYRFPISADKYRKANLIASPLNMLDSSTVADGAAALLLAGPGLARELGGVPVRIAGSAIASDTLALHSRRDPLHLDAAQRSATTALKQARLSLQDIDVLELTDPHGIAAALALESCGFVPPGEAPRHAADGGITPVGNTPLATAGGYKARGDVLGASGVYQIVELVRQLRGEAGQTQVPNARIAFAQCLGGIGATSATHVLVAE